MTYGPQEIKLLSSSVIPFRYNCYEKKIINYLRLIVLLMATTTIFTYIYSKLANDVPKQQVQSINVENIYARLDEIDIKMDRILEEAKVRDTIVTDF